ncbi:hypothetical protein KAH81_07750 [bacterium]|nr:hypothetical protein [bacterium]
MKPAIFLLLVIIATTISFAQTHDSIQPCPGCDLPLKGITLGGFFGGSTFSVDSDSPTVAEAIDIDALPSIAFRAGGGLYLYPGGRYRIGLIGGYNWASSGNDDVYIKTNALWTTLLVDLIRTTSAVHIMGGIGAGGGLATVKGSELGKTGEVSENVPVFALLPRFGVEIPIAEIGAISLEFSYLWFFGEEKTLTWETQSIEGSPNERQLDFSPIEIGGPSFTLGLQFGKVKKLEYD